MLTSCSCYVDVTLMLLSWEGWGCQCYVEGLGRGPGLF